MKKCEVFLSVSHLHVFYAKVNNYQENRNVKFEVFRQPRRPIAHPFRARMPFGMAPLSSS